MGSYLNCAMNHTYDICDVKHNFASSYCAKQLSGIRRSIYGIDSNLTLTEKVLKKMKITVNLAILTDEVTGNEG